MAPYAFPTSARARVIETIRELDNVSVCAVAPEPLRTEGAVWWQFFCEGEGSRVLLAISEHRELTSEVLVTVSPDLKRVWRLWGFWRDVRLASQIRNRLREVGGRALED